MRTRWIVLACGTVMAAVGMAFTGLSAEAASSLPGAAATTGASNQPRGATSDPGSISSAPLGVGRIQFGPTYTGYGTYYGATGAGNCMYDAGGDLMVAAMNQLDYENSQACGDFISITGPKGTVTVKIVDRCPECKAGDVDLSRQAFAKIAAVSAGKVKISWRLLSPSLATPVAYRYKEGSSRYWCAIQVRNHRNPIRSLWVDIGGAWRKLPRQDYNYFVSADGVGCGGTIRIADIYGNVLTDKNIKLSVGTVQPGTRQFGMPR
jgi:expansin (peptidoglycan-binding protein)